VWPRQPDNALDLLKDAMEDPTYDPDAVEPYKGLWRHENGRIATPEEVKRAHPESRLVESMAEEMKAEIDEEIMRELAAGIVFNPSIVGPVDPSPAAIPVEIQNAIELAPVPRWMKDAAIKVWTDGLEKLENLP